MLTRAERRVIHLLQDGGGVMNHADRLMQGVRPATLSRLENKGLVKYQPYARPEPVWRLTAAGRSTR